MQILFGMFDKPTNTPHNTELRFIASMLISEENDVCRAKYKHYLVFRLLSYWAQLAAILMGFSAYLYEVFY